MTKLLLLAAIHNYFSQVHVQTQMGVTGKRWCDFSVYTIHGVHLERIMFNQRGCRLQILDAAESSFNNHIAPEL